MNLKFAHLQHPSVPQSTISHYTSIPWLLDTLSDFSFEPVSSMREVSDSGRGHTLMGKTWNTPETIPYRLTLHRQPRPSQPLEVRRLYTFGIDLNAHPNLLHGGVVGCLLDSSLGEAAAVFIRSELGVGVGEAGPIYTVQLNVGYKKPIKTPGTVMVRSWVDGERTEGRKVWAKGRVEGEGGVVHAEAEGLWVRAKPKGKGEKL